MRAAASRAAGRARPPAPASGHAGLPLLHPLPQSSSSSCLARNLNPACHGTGAAPLAGRRGRLTVRAGADSGNGAGGPPAEPGPGSDQPQQGPQEVALVRRIPPIGYTFVLAGLLKIMTIGFIATTAPQGCVRTVAGQMAPYMLVPFGLLLCFLGKVIVDAGLHESNRFMAGLMAVLVFLYFGMYKVLYRYEPSNRAEFLMRMKPGGAARLQQLRQQQAAARGQAQPSMAPVSGNTWDNESAFYTPPDGSGNIAQPFAAARTVAGMQDSMARTPELAARNARLERQIPRGVLGTEEGLDSDAGVAPAGPARGGRRF